MLVFKLTYFNARGFAETSRLLFALAKVPYEDIRVPYTFGQQFEIPPELKQKLPYGQLPYLTFGNVKLSQSWTIARFLARKFGLYGADELEAAKIDEIVDASRDYADSFWPFRIVRNDEEKKNIMEVITPRYMGKFNEILENSQSGYLVGKSVSLADVHMFNFITSVGSFEGLDITRNYPAVQNLVKRVAVIPPIQDWVAKRPKTLV